MNKQFFGLLLEYFGSLGYNIMGMGVEKEEEKGKESRDISEYCEYDVIEISSVLEVNSNG